MMLELGDAKLSAIRASKPRTIPEQIADEIGIAVLEGRYAAGARMGEQELAELYSVSRGPIREAIRILERRGLVEFFPRRGAFVVELSLDTIADIFNLQAVFLGLAARYLARKVDPDGLKAVASEIDALEELHNSPNCDPVAFAIQSGRVGSAIKRNSGNSHLLRITSLVAEESLWGFVWYQRPLDYLTTERRAAGLQLWKDILETAKAGDEFRTESLTQQVLFDSRDNALSVLASMRSGTTDPLRQLSNTSSQSE